MCIRDRYQRRVHGEQGIYFANIYDRVKVEMINYQIQNFDRMKTKIAKHLEDFKQSFISFNKGKTWQFITAPAHDSTGIPIVCPSNNCSLHLHNLASDKFSSIYSHENAIGLLIGTGNIGPYLSNKQSDINTYISWNFGQTWIEMIKGSFFYETENYGGIIILVPNQQPTNIMYYSLNSGQSIQEIKLSLKMKRPLIFYCMDKLTM
eukprot:TRINITY_DN6240_c0_g1_i2.p1 TRINITY_DN6240_c0_g1~~TRINITY_DN6240_c0_g1_i2.p1  ORF type:complete len:206 (-),score=27.60 TRINITY_DN6240_c0_g1_i2:809-1426(-)